MLSMIRHLLLFSLSGLAVYQADAQTKVIAHRSHSGSMTVFKASMMDDNLGWVGVPTRPMELDTATFSVLPTDSSQLKPYCNNPNTSPDSVAKTYPFYSSAVNDTLTPAQKKEDSLAKQKEHIQSREEIEKKEKNPKSEEFYGLPLNPPGPGAGFILGVILVAAFAGTLIWLYNRRQIAR